MTTAFPAIQPTGYEHSAAEFPTTSTRSLSGVRSYRIWGDKPAGATMTLQFANKTQAEGAQILAAYYQAKGPIDDLTVPPIVWNGITDQALLGLLEFAFAESGLKWYFLDDEAPRLERPQRSPTRVSVTVRLRAEFRL